MKLLWNNVLQKADQASVCKLTTTHKEHDYKHKKRCIKPILKDTASIFLFDRGLHIGYGFGDALKL